MTNNIENGWYMEKNSQWPGQAMALEVKKVLHEEKSKYQDVLVFESTHHGNVLVLDNAIQCVENDEFSYQEMITHLPMASHPNPVNVLVVGGGDGGVLREVLKHPSVKSATLVDIDEAVPRVSKQFLPHMAAGFNDPRVTVHIGDGFKFLEDRKNQFDVIITDSSDPVGPAEALFQKPYFQLLKDALKEDGHISTQGECIWLHLPLIKELLASTRTLFPASEYAYTSIPTYPSGTIGFVVCSKDGSHNLKKALRKVDGCRYYNEAVHEASFVLPTFAAKGIASADAAVKANGSAQPKKILLLGSGFVAQPCAEYVLRRSENSLTIGE
jgi:spermidine synthase